MDNDRFEMMWDSLSEFIEKELDTFSPYEDSSLYAIAVCRELRTIQGKMDELYYTFSDD